MCGCALLPHYHDITKDEIQKCEAALTNQNHSDIIRKACKIWKSLGYEMPQNILHLNRLWHLIDRKVQISRKYYYKVTSIVFVNKINK